MEGRDFRYIIGQVELFYTQILSPTYSRVLGKVGGIGKSPAVR
jgi:hypothetical protein